MAFRRVSVQSDLILPELPFCQSCSSIICFRNELQFQQRIVDELIEQLAVEHPGNGP